MFDLFTKPIHHIIDPDIEESIEYPPVVKVTPHKKELITLLDRISDGRRGFINSISFHGGYQNVATNKNTPLNLDPKSFEALKNQDQVRLGEFSPVSGRVKIYMDVILASTLDTVDYDIDRSDFESVFTDTFTSTVVEELEHSYQDSESFKYLPTNPLQWFTIMRPFVTMMVAAFAGFSIAASVYDQELDSRYFQGIVFLFGFMVSLIVLMTIKWPKILQDLWYRINLIEREAKKREEESEHHPQVMKAFVIDFDQLKKDLKQLQLKK